MVAAGGCGDESPARAVNADQPTTFSRAFTPQDFETCHMTNALVRRLNKVHAHAPLQLVLLGGNLIDNAQQNESSWCSTLQLRAAAPRACCGAADVEACVRPMLDEARADKKWVILAAHQRAVGLARRGPLVD